MNPFETGDALESGDDAVHDQLPSVEEYKANMNGTSSISMNEKAVTSGVDTEGGDDEEAVVHDQLPSVEDIKATNDRTNGASWVSICGVIACFLVVALIIIIPVALIDDDETSMAQASGGGGSGVTRDPDRVNAIIKYLGDLNVSNRADMMTRGTPQFNAVEWIASQDTMNMAVPTGSQKFSRFAERYALAVIYYSTNGPFWNFGMNFLSGDDHCDWNDRFITGGGALITLGVVGCTIVPSSTETAGGFMLRSLALPLNQLFGSIPDEIEYLNNMQTFVASFNSGLSGEIPESVRSLTNLQDLELQYCFLRGTIPSWIGELSNLEYLGLGNNRFEGAIPQSFFQLTNLQFLGLDDNFLEGNVGSFSSLSNLENLYLEDNTITGELSVSLINSWPKMTDLDLSMNMIDSTLPPNIFSMPSLEVLDIHANQLHGALPQNAFNNEVLKFVALFDNDLTGPIPDTLSNIVNLQHLDLARNDFTSTIPDSVGQLNSLKYLFLGENLFSEGDIPDFITDLTTLEELSLKSANRTGTIPANIGMLSNLILLDLDQNDLTGTLPDELGLLTDLAFFLLNRNELTGTLPLAMASMNSLQIVLLDGNEFSGTAAPVCLNPNLPLQYFVTDCEGPNAEISCSCCDLCCNDSNSTCNEYKWTANLDPIREYDYGREIYEFSTEVTQAIP